MRTLLEALAAELERPRHLPAQVINYLTGTYNLDRAAVGNFLVHKLPELEDYEVDLALSPVFTPTLNDQAVFAELLGQESVPVPAWAELVQQLVGRPTRAQLVTEDDQKHAVPLRDVSVERFVHRLSLDGTIPEPVLAHVDQSPPADRPLLKAVARRAAWKTEPRQNILHRYLASATSTGSYRLDDVVELLKLVEIYQPADEASLLAQIPHWLQVLRQEINESAGGKPFFNDRVEGMHGGGRDQRRPDSSRLTAKENERAFLERLARVLDA